MKRLLVVPAAGRGTRLGWDGPKVLCPVGGRPMIEHLLDRYEPVVDHVVVVVAPQAQDDVSRVLARRAVPAECVVQPEPTGMLPAILCALPPVEARAPRHVWVTWCDQIGIGQDTVSRLATATESDPEAAMTFPTVRQEPPYIHFSRDRTGRIVDVRQRRDGDDMPPAGESDAGLFALRLDTFRDALPRYAREAPVATTGERNFLPFIPWLAARARVTTFPLTDARQAVGVNTLEDLRSMETYLRGAD
jgi:bifunctional UDP-N-acetylglucosamine pyrophosphorylase/glucosamine-1-phosphate N-acetyltransferase